eukprot:scaffold16349_cov146-Skeletonema_menzelii.AAC.2
MLRSKDLECFTFTVTGTSALKRYTNHLDPSKIRGALTQFEIETIVRIQSLVVKANSFAFIAEVLGRTSADCADAWRNHLQPPLLEELESLTGRTELTAEEGTNYDFGSEEVKTLCTKAVVESYRKKFPTPSNDSRIKTATTLPVERVTSLAEERNSKKSKSMANTAKKKATRQKKDERASKRAKKVESARALLKTVEEVKQLESENVEAGWVKAKNSARKAILSAGHTAKELDDMLELARLEFTKHPLGRSMNEAKKAFAAKRKEEERKFLADVSNNN